MLGAATEPAQLLTQHLIQHGHKRIGMIGGPASASTSRERAEGYRQALREAGLDEDPSLYRESRFSRSDGSHIGRELLEDPDRPTALLTANSFLAFGVIDAAESLGLSVPDDLAIASFDDFEIGPREPILTCADQPAGDIAELAARRLLARLRGDDSEPRTVIVGTDSESGPRAAARRRARPVSSNAGRLRDAEIGRCVGDAKISGEIGSAINIAWGDMSVTAGLDVCTADLLW